MAGPCAMLDGAACAGQQLQLPAPLVAGLLVAGPLGSGMQLLLAHRGLPRSARGLCTGQLPPWLCTPDARRVCAVCRPSRSRTATCTATARTWNRTRSVRVLGACLPGSDPLGRHGARHGARHGLDLASDPHDQSARPCLACQAGTGLPAWHVEHGMLPGTLPTVLTCWAWHLADAGRGSMNSMSTILLPMCCRGVGQRVVVRVLLLQQGTRLSRLYMPCTPCVLLSQLTRH